MKILKRSEFLKCSKGTLFNKFIPNCSEHTCVFQGAFGSNDFIYQRLDAVDAVDCHSSVNHAEILLEAQNTGKSYNLDFEGSGRDGCFDDEKVLFIIWETKDVQQLIQKLKDCLNENQTNTRRMDGY